MFPTTLAIASAYFPYLDGDNIGKFNCMNTLVRHSIRRAEHEV